MIACKKTHKFNHKTN